MKDFARDPENTLLYHMAEEQGDLMARAALKDKAEESALDAYWRPDRGEKVLILTGAFYHCGVVLGEDMEYICLGPDSVTILETGPFNQLMENGRCGQCEVVKPVSLIKKSCIAQIIKWPLAKLPSRN